MQFSVAELVAELKLLRKGRGIETPDIESRVGPALRWAAGVDAGDSPVHIRSKITNHLRALVERLPGDLRLATGAAFGLEGGLRMRLYQERVSSVARTLDRDPRTVQRRINDGITRIAELAVERDDPRPADGVRPPWRTLELTASVVLDLPAPEVIEVRRIMAEQDQLTEVELSVTVTPPPGWHGGNSLDGLGLDVLYGGTLTSRAMKSSSRMSFALLLAEPIDRNDEHEFALRIKLPPGRGMAPHYVCTPRYPCALFRLHVRFGPGRAPRSTWRLQSTCPLELSDPASDREPVTADRSGELYLVFTDLEPNLSYGVVWDPEPPDDRTPN